MRKSRLLNLFRNQNLWKYTIISVLITRVNALLIGLQSVMMATILFPWSREQDESHTIFYSIASCLNYIRLYIRGLINGLFQNKKNRGVGDGGGGDLKIWNFHEY